jgi:SOUL heme-binding protein
VNSLQSGLTLGALASFCLLSLPPSAMANEEPKYTVILSDEDFEIRRYQPFIVAETVVDSADVESGSNQGFRRLAGYIFGGNRTKESISMTAPVSTARSEKISMTAPVESHMAGTDLVMTFMMPSEYTLATLPEPNDPRVLLKEVPGRVVAAIKFSGSWSEERFQEHTEMLLKWLRERDIKVVGVPSVARYDAPWTPWFMRRNEILIEVAYAAEEKGEAIKEGRHTP